MSNENSPNSGKANDQSWELLWAPWRLGYVAGDEQVDPPPPVPNERLLPGAEHDCFLCHAAADEPEGLLDAKRHVILRTDNAVAVLNRYPYSNGHLLVAPRQHVGDFSVIPAEIHTEMNRVLAQLIDLLRDLIRADGFNVGLNLGRVAGAGVPGHLHWHLLPRWEGDVNFMPTLAGTKVIPQSLDALCQILREAIRS